MPPPTSQLYPSNMIGIAVGTSAVQLIGANPTRNGLAITNLHATQTISITNRQNASPTSLQAGSITIPAASTVIFGAGLPSVPGSSVVQYGFSWTDVVNAIASGATTNCTVTEF